MTKIIVTGHPDARQAAFIQTYLRYAAKNPFNQSQFYAEISDPGDVPVINQHSTLLATPDAFFETVIACKNRGHRVVVIYATIPNNDRDKTFAANGQTGAPNKNTDALTTMERIFVQNGILPGIGLDNRLRPIGARFFGADQLYIWQDDGRDDSMVRSVQCFLEAEDEELCKS